MLNPALDLPALSQRFARDGRIRIADALEPAAANALADEMAKLRYQLFCATGAGVAVLDHADIASWTPDRRTELTRHLHEAAAKGEGFAYDGFRMTEAWTQGSPDTPLGRLHAALSAPATLQAVRTITGASQESKKGFDNAFAQATRYLPGHYLTRHLDDPKGEHRKFAFVLGLSRQWDPDWGGLLQFYDDHGAPTDALSPGDNTLDLFDVHSVTYVAPFARAPRLAISGWFVSGDPLKPAARTKAG
jgi:SM-20-related protein